jgi:adenosine deaminase
MRRSTLSALAAKAGVVPTLPRSYGSFAAFTETITTAAACLRTPEDVSRLVDEVVEDAVQAGAVWVEPSMWPGLFRGRLGSDADAVDVVLAAGQEAQRRHGVGFGLIVAANRNRPPAEATALARLAASRMTSGVVGFGLDGDEKEAGGELFAEAFALAHDAGLMAVPHAGELRPADAVVEAMDVLGTDRIMHGVTAVRDPAVVERLIARNIALDICPTSNVMLSVFSSIDAHPLPDLIVQGVRCSINADDPLLFDTGLLDEYVLARDELSLTDEQLAACARTSLSHSGAPSELVDVALTAIDDWLAA